MTINDFTYVDNNLILIDRKNSKQYHIYDHKGILYIYEYHKSHKSRLNSYCVHHSKFYDEDLYIKIDNMVNYDLLHSRVKAKETEEILKLLQRFAEFLSEKSFKDRKIKRELKKLYKENKIQEI
nr:MAG TPA: hypothetical protein [Caudoviricetes sp.]